MGVGKNQFFCHECESSYPIEIYRIEYTDECFVLNCNQCALTLVIIGDDWDAKLDPNKSKKIGFEKYTEESLKPCRCGGVYRFSAPHRCPVCLSAVSIEVIKKQIDWWGTEDGIPGVVMGIAYSSSNCWK